MLGKLQVKRGQFHDLAAILCLLLFSCQVVSNSLRPHGLQHAKLPCLSPLPEFAQTHVHGVTGAIQPSSSVAPLLLLPSIFPSIRVFSSESALHQAAGVLELQLQHE